MHNFTKDFWDQHKFFVGQTLERLTDENRNFRLTAEGSTVGFLLQHVSESKIILLQLFFGIEVDRPLPTTNGATDMGQAGDVAYIKQLHVEANQKVEDLMASFTQEQLAETVETFLGPMTRANIFGVFIYHTYHHGGQASMALKRGRVFEDAMA
jgi:uncharacterized damage-inducible protein DinB